MILRPPRSTRTDTLFPYTTLFRSLGSLEKIGAAPNRRGTLVAFTPDIEIFGELKFKPARLYRLARSKAYLFAGVEIRWKCAPELITDDTPAEAVFQFPGGLSDHQIGRASCRERVCQYV